MRVLVPVQAGDPLGHPSCEGGNVTGTHVHLARKFNGEWIGAGGRMPSLRVLLLVALDMLRAQRSRVHETSEETEAGARKADIAITPLAMPMLAGPGAISTALLLHNQAANFVQRLGLYISIVLVSLASYVILRIAAKSTKLLNPIAMNIATRIMGLLLAAVAIQFMLNALKQLSPKFFEAL